MSRGLGRIERAILDIIVDDDACQERYAAEDLARAVYQPEKPGRRPTQSEHVAALRAMHSLTRKYPHKLVLTRGKGRGPLWLERQR
jgi:hypothetical protein